MVYNNNYRYKIPDLQKYQRYIYWIWLRALLHDTVPAALSMSKRDRHSR